MRKEWEEGGGARLENGENSFGRRRNITGKGGGIFFRALGGGGSSGVGHGKWGKWNCIGEGGEGGGQDLRE